MGTVTAVAVVVVMVMGTPATMHPRSITLVQHSTTDGVGVTPRELTTDGVGVTLRELTTVGVEQAGGA
jgi:hypothetical protein